MGLKVTDQNSNGDFLWIMELRKILNFIFLLIYIIKWTYISFVIKKIKIKESHIKVK